MHKRIAFLLSFTFAAFAHAAPPSAESVQELLTVTKIEQTLDTMHQVYEQSILQGMEESTKGKQLSAKQQKALEAFVAGVGKIFKEEMSWKKWMPKYIKIYQETYTQEEVDGLIAFNKSPVGQAAVAKMPVVMQKSMAMAQEEMGPTMQKVEALMKDLMQGKAPAKEAKE